MKLGAQFFTLREKNKTPEGLYNSFKKVKEIGYQVVQMSAICQIEAERLRSFSDEFELPITVTHSPLDRILNDTDALINEHKIYGCPVIGLGMMAGVGGTVGNIVGNSINGAFAPMQFGEQQAASIQLQSEQKNTSVCAKCGSPLAPGAKFCMECGEKVVVLPEGMVKCSGCGEIVPQGKFCPECGNKLV